MRAKTRPARCCWSGGGWCSSKIPSGVHPSPPGTHAAHTHTLAGTHALEVVSRRHPISGVVAAVTDAAAAVVVDDAIAVTAAPLLRKQLETICAIRSCDAWW